MAHDHSHGHSHGHSHDHGGCGCESHQQQNQPKPYSYSSLFKDEEPSKKSSVDHSHEHGHAHSHAHEDKVESAPKPPALSLLTLINDKNVNGIITLLTQNPALLDVTDELGNYPIHWACKKSDIILINTLLDYGANLNLASTSDNKMYPIHWAAAENRVDVLAFLLTGRSPQYNIQRPTAPFTNLNVLNGNNCTPASVAIQYKRYEAFIYLMEKGADPTLPDVNGDECLHWAAYKGDLEMSSLVLYYTYNRVNICDKFGQTPLHLAAIKGNTLVVELLLRKYGADYAIKDNSNNTALDCAMNKKHFKTEWEIRRFLVNSQTTGGGGSELSTKYGCLNSVTQGFLCYNCGGIFNSIRLLSRMYREGRFGKSSEFFKMMLFGSNEYEWSVWMWRLTFLSNLYATYLAILFNFNEKINHHTTILTISSVLLVIWWFCFIGCLVKDPGVVTEDQPDDIYTKKINKNNYYKLEEGDTENEMVTPYKKCLQSVVNYYENNEKNEKEILSMCHTCRIQKPIRSKHCKIVNKCIYKFDHFCPFVYNVVARDNYKFFFGLLIIHPFAYSCFIYLAINEILQEPNLLTISYTGFLIYSFFMCLMVLGLGKYHLDLICSNLTTNEDMNKSRYAYLNSKFGGYKNPFVLGSMWENMCDGLFPSGDIFFTKKDIENKLLK